jgi:hypothetical protein
MRGAMRAVAGAVVLVLLARAGASAQQDKPVTFADVAAVPALSADDAARLARYVGERLHESKSIAPLPPALKGDAAPRIVFVSASDGEQTAHVAMSGARGAVRAADAGIARVAKLLPDVSQRLWIKVDVVNHVEPLPTGATRLGMGIHPSLDGLELAGGAAFLPEELVGWHIVEGDRLIENSVYDYLDARPARAALAADGEVRGVRKFACASFFIEDDNTPVPLFRGHRAFETATPVELRAAADAAGAYMARSVTETGRLEYSYRLDADEIPREYDIVRHAGAIWAMLDVYRDTKDEELLAAIDRAMRYLLAQVRPMHVGADAQAVGVVENDEASLGGNALTALALGTYIEVTGKKDHLPILRVLGRSMRAAQAPGGRFTIQRQRLSTGDVMLEDGPYAPGEAVLALLKVHDVDPDPALLDAAVRGGRYLITVRDAELRPEELLHDHWLLYALRRLHAKKPDPMWVDHAVKLSRLIVEEQHKPGEPNVASDGYGSWMDARSTPAAVRAEGLLSAAALMQNVGRTADANDFRNAARASIAFQLRTQVWPESAMHCRNPRRAIGGVRDALGGVYVRIDFVQHSLSSILELMRQTAGPAAPPAPPQ